MKKLMFVLSLLMLTNVSLAQNNNNNKEPDLNTLKSSTFMMGPGNASNPIHDSWIKPVEIMRQTAVFDALIKEVEAVVCGTEQNKSVLLVGEPDNFYRYIFARLATRPGSLCPGMWHTEVDINKIEAGHKYVGEVDEYYRKYLLEPAANRNVILYLHSLGGIIGLGSHSNDDTGVEREYSSNISSGQLRSIAFMDKYEYNEKAHSKHAYVMESFARKIILPPVTQGQASELVVAYLAALYPQLKFDAQGMDYLLKSSLFYMPNRNEPDRSLAIVNKLAREAGEAAKEEKGHNQNISPPSEPYGGDLNLTWTVEHPGAQQIKLKFDYFDLENSYDILVVKDATGRVLASLSGNLGAFETPYYQSSKLVLEFKSDASGTNRGFKISKSTEAIFKDHIFTITEIRNAIMTVAQVPQWLIDRDYTVIRNLFSLLDADVVGVTEGKRDLVRLSKNGYVAGRTDDKPVATVMLAGPTGTGKSYIAKKFAEFTGQKLITLDMTSYKDAESFVTFQEVMARNLINTPYAVYLFEEIDKASIEVLDQLYFMMDEGVFYDRNQRPLFARGAFMLFTTNAASDAILANPKAPNLRELVMADLAKTFRSSFLNRFDAVSIFLPFTDEEYRKLAQIMVNKKIQKIKEFFNWNMKVDAATVDYITAHGKSAIFGARPMERLVESSLGIGIAEYQLENGVIPENANIEYTKLAPANRFKIKVNGVALEFEVDPSNNSGVPPVPFKNFVMKQHDMKTFFESIRDYED